MNSEPKQPDRMTPPPHLMPLDLERNIIGDLLNLPEHIDDVARVTPDGAMFFVYAHQKVFEAMVTLRRRGVVPDLPAVHLEMTQQGTAKELGERPLSWLYEVKTECGVGANFHTHVEAFADSSLRRALWHAANEFASEIASPPSGSADEMAARWEATLRKAMESGGTARNIPVLADVIRRTLEELDERMASGKGGGIPTGLADLDRLLGGMRPGQLIVVGARPGAGKTALALAFLKHVAQSCNVPAYIASLEMPATELGHRVLSMETNVPLHKLNTATVSAAEVDRLAATLSPGSLGNVPLYIDDCPGATTPARLSADIRRLVRLKGVRLAAIDYLQLMQPSGRTDSRVQDVGQMARDAKLLARDLNIPVILLSQLNRQSESRPDGKPKLSDLRESGEVEQHADAVVLLHVPAGQEERLPCWHVNALVAKNRNGPPGEVPLIYRRSVVRFENAARGYDARDAA